MNRRGRRERRDIGSVLRYSSALSASSAVNDHGELEVGIRRGGCHPAPRALSLIELLVVIVILTTLIAGVIPILSPNNDGRKIRTAARGLQSYLTIAQAEAARTGRPHGVAFRESAPGSGVALEAFTLEVPQAFAGFSEDSRVTVGLAGQVYGPAGNMGVKFSPRYDGFELYDINFVVVTPPATNPDPFPPRMFRIGDQINIDGNIFLIVDDDDDAMPPNEIETFGNVDYLVSPSPIPTRAIWLNGQQGQVLPPPNTLERYQIIRQPTNSIESPFQLPSGIAIDLQGSGLEGADTSPFALPEGSFDIAGTQDIVGIMFSPNGGLESVHFNGNQINSMSRVFLLLGRVENGGRPSVDLTFDFSTLTTNEQLEEKRQEVNWLDLDSRWMMIGAQNGRIVVTENAFVDPSTLADPTSATDQIEAAHEFVHEMKR